MGFQKKSRKQRSVEVFSTDFPWSDLLSFRFSSLFLAFSHISLISRFLFKISSFGDFESLRLHRFCTYNYIISRLLRLMNKEDILFLISLLALSVLLDNISWAFFKISSCIFVSFFSHSKLCFLNRILVSDAKFSTEAFVILSIVVIYIYTSVIFVEFLKCLSGGPLFLVTRALGANATQLRVAVSFLPLPAVFCRGGYRGWGGNNVLFSAFLSKKMFSCTCQHAGWYAAASSLALANTRDVALPQLLLHLPSCGVLRCRIFSCTCHPAYAAASSLALAIMRDGTLPRLLLHLPTCEMVRCRTFSCTCRHAGCYAAASSLALANVRGGTLLHLLLHLPSCGMVRCRVLSCTCQHAR